MKVIALISLCLLLNAAQCEDKKDVFEPSHEWKVVKKGQPLPRGLHVRVNFETGVTEAKYPEINEKQETSALTFNPADMPAENNILSVSELKEALKKMKRDESKSSRPKESFRSYEDIKKDLGELSLTPSSESEVLKSLLKKHADIVASKNFIEEELLLVLEDIEFLVHLHDNGRDFVNLNGFKDVVYANMNSSYVAVKSEVLKLLGSSMQNNPTVKIHALDTGCMDILLRALALETDITVKNRVIFALGSLLRGFPRAQLKFMQNAGLNVLSNLFECNDLKIKIRCVTLLKDLILEEEVATKGEYKGIKMKEKLIENDFCSHFNKLLIDVIAVDASDWDSIAKALSVMASVANECASEYKDEVIAVVVTLISELKTLAAKDDNDDYVQLLDLANKIFKSIKYKRKQEL